MERERIEEIIHLPGEACGSTLQTDLEYIKNHFGDEGVRKVKALLASWGYPIEYEKIKAMEWFPAGLRGLSLLAIKETFNLNDEQLVSMGNEAPKHSFLIKLLMGTFLSVEQILKNGPNYWKKHWSIGSAEVWDYDPDKKTVKYVIKDFKLDPSFCRFFSGYLLRMMQYARKGVRIEETKCMFRGDPYHEYTGRWD